MDELPLPVVAQMKAREAAGLSAAAPVDNPVEKKRTTLLGRLMSAGLGRSAEDAVPVQQPAVATMPHQPVRQSAPEMRRPSAPPVAPRREPAGLDMHGRPAAPTRTSLDDEHLDIPAFLRRQAN